MKQPKHVPGTSPNPPYAIRTGGIPERVSINIMSLRSDVPLWTLNGLATDSATYQALKALGYPVSEVVNADGGILPDVFIMYVRTDEQAYRIYMLLQKWPRTHTFKEKILRYMSEHSPYKLP